MGTRIWPGLVMVVTLTILTPASHGAVYKWVDANGKVHYGSKPPSGQQATEVRTKSAEESEAAPASDAERRSRRKKILDAYEAERRQKREADAKKAEQQRKVAGQCDKARSWLKQEDGAPSLYRTDKDGQRQYLSTEQRSELVAKMQKFVRKNC